MRNVRRLPDPQSVLLAIDEYVTSAQNTEFGRTDRLRRFSFYTEGLTSKEHSGWGFSD
jgi:hypothetical protein